MDESADVENKAILLVYVRHINQDACAGLFVCFKSTNENKRGGKNFKYMSDKPSWDSSVRVGSDGAAAATGRLSGLVTRVKQVAPNCESAHRFACRRSPAR